MRSVKIGRRAFVQGSLVAGLLPVSSWATAEEKTRRAANGAPQARLHKLLVDRTIPESVSLGTYASDTADEVFEFDGDLTRLWNDDLRLQWPNGPRPIAGLTTPSVLMVLEQLGRDHGARIVFSAEHCKVGDRIQHRVFGCESHIQATRDRRGVDCVGDMALHIAGCPHDTTARPATLAYDTSLGPNVSASRQRLVTWVLAPVSRPDAPISSETASQQ